MNSTDVTVYTSEEDLPKHDVDSIMNMLLSQDNKQARLEIMDIGSEAQNTFKRKSPLLETKLKDLFEDNALSKDINVGLTQMHKTLGRINVDKITRSGLIQKIFGKGSIAKKITLTSAKYQSVAELINTISSHLKEGKSKLETTIEDLMALSDELKAQRITLNRYIDLLTLLTEQIQTKLESITDPSHKDDLSRILNFSLMKLQDFKAMQLATTQFLTTVHIMNDNHYLQFQSVDRVCHITLQLAHTGLIIQAALQEQKRVLDATKATQCFASELLIQNADSLQSVVDQTQEIYTSPVLDVEKLKTAHEKMVFTIGSIQDITSTHKKCMLDTIKELDKLSDIKIPGHDTPLSLAE